MERPASHSSRAFASAKLSLVARTLLVGEEGLGIERAGRSRDACQNRQSDKSGKNGFHGHLLLFSVCMRAARPGIACEASQASVVVAVGLLPERLVLSGAGRSSGDAGQNRQ